MKALHALVFLAATIMSSSQAQDSAAPTVPPVASTTQQQQPTSPTDITTSQTTAQPPNPTQQTSIVTQNPNSPTTPIQQTSVVQVTLDTTVQVTASTTVNTQPSTVATPSVVQTTIQVSPTISIDPVASQAVVIVANVTTTVPIEQASSVASSLATSLQNSGSSNNSGSGTSTKAWAIPVGVVGGLLVLGLAGFFIWRCNKRRFTGLDDDNAPIRWPELKSEDGTSGAFLMPAGVRQQRGHGVDFGTDEDQHGQGDQSIQSNRFSMAEMSSVAGHSAASYPQHQSQQYYDDGRSPYDPFASSRSTPYSADYSHAAYSQNSHSPENMSRRPSNMSLRSLPPGAGSPAQAVVQRDNSDGRLAYDFDEEEQLMDPASLSGESIDRSGTVRSTGGTQKLAVANPDS